MSDLEYNSFSTLYNSYVVPVANYGAAGWDYNDYPAPRVLQKIVNRFYLGVHRFATAACVSIEMNLPTLKSCRWLEMLRYHNRIMLLKEDRLPKLIYKYDVNSNKNAWVSEILHEISIFQDQSMKYYMTWKWYSRQYLNILKMCGGRS